MKTAALFVGGPWDGQKRDVPHAATYHVAVGPTYVSYGTEMIEQLEPIPAQRVTYDRVASTGDIAFYIVSPAGPPTESKMAILLRALAWGYRNV